MKTLTIIAFRGVGSNEQYSEESSLVKLGHVGIQFEGETVIYGFRPTPSAIELYKDEKGLLDALGKGVSVEGGIFDDTEFFARAYQLSMNNPRSEVWEFPIALNDNEYETKKTLIENFIKLCYIKYRLPQTDNEDNELFEENFHNCATFPRELGLILPANTGYLTPYLAAIKNKGKRWHPSTN